MPNKSQYQICIVCEGEEEFDYLNRLKELGVFSKKYLIRLDNARTITQIVPHYHSWYGRDDYDLVLVFCDTEMTPYDQFNKIKLGLLNLFCSKKLVEKVLFFANPCTMQIILSHFQDIKLKSNNKKVNSPIIAKLTGVKNYSAKERQRYAIMKKLNTNNYEILKNNLSKLETKDTILGSTNFLKLLNCLESDNPKWIRDLIKELDK